MTNPGIFSDPVNGEYQMLAVGETFRDLAELPTLFKTPGVVDANSSSATDEGSQICLQWSLTLVHLDQ